MGGKLLNEMMYQMRDSVHYILPGNETNIKSELNSFASQFDTNTEDQYMWIAESLIFSFFLWILSGRFLASRCQVLSVSVIGRTGAR